MAPPPPPSRGPDEAETRRLIDAQLRAAGWEADSERLTHERGTRPASGRFLAISEWPTAIGRADYVLFVEHQAVAVVEAKRWSTDIPGSLLQARRYAASLDLRGGGTLPPGSPWGASQVPFLFATNGRPVHKQLETQSGIWFQDGRRPSNLPRALSGWYTPEALLDLLRQDVEAAEAKLRDTPVELPSLNLRDYQLAAIRAVEQALLQGQRTCLVAMATGTGKTRTCLGLVYRLMQAERFRRVLFIVDRSALGTQAADTFRCDVVDGHQTFESAYGVEELQKGIQRETSRLHIATVQGLVKRILSPEGAPPPPTSAYDCIIVDECHRGYTLDREMSDAELTFQDQDDYLSKYRRALEHFDAVKIGLTATPALHTREIFGPPIFEYRYRQAVIDGWLVDHEPPIRIETELSARGIHMAAGEEVTTLDLSTSQLELFRLPDELDFEVEHFNRLVINENFNREVAMEVTRQVDPRLPGKTLVFCVNDKHADMMVTALQRALVARYGDEVDSKTVLKITGQTYRVDQAIREFKNERLPSIAVTVDLLTTGIDVPSIRNLVFVRRVKSRILYDQMIGRATRLHRFQDGTPKEVFRIFDAVDQYGALSRFTDMKPVAARPFLSFTALVEELRKVGDEARARDVLDQLLAKLQRKKATLRERHGELFEAVAGASVEDVLSMLRHASVEEAAAWFEEHPRVSEILDELTGGGPRHVYLSDEPDALRSVTHGYGEGRQRPEDYLEGFGRFVRENVNRLPALMVVTQRPRELTRETLKSLLLALAQAGYTEQQLRTAWRDVKNEDIAASIIGFVRQQALGEPLVPYTERVDRALRKLLASRSWTPQQRMWLERIGKQLKANVV